MPFLPKYLAAAVVGTLAVYVGAPYLPNILTPEGPVLDKIRSAMKEAGLEKSMIDELRCLNGNLKISLGLPQIKREVL